MPWRIAGIAVAVAAVLVVSVGAFAIVSGVYSVAATSKHFYITDRLIKFALRRSIAVRSSAIDVPDLNDAGLIKLGSEHFRFGCAPCHGSPDRRQNPIVARMYPAPPRLDHAVASWTSGELFWIVKHGLKFTGMPAWPGEGRDDEIWPVVAYLNALEDGSDRATAEALDRPDVPVSELGAAPAGSCARCHRDADTPPISGTVPSLYGQNAQYLVRALREYSAGSRESGMMGPIAARLTSAEIERLAGRYAALALPPADAAADSGGDLGRGRQIAERGVPAAGIPPCLACHFGQSSSTFPKLGGLSARYVKSQLELWQRGHRQGTAYGAIMATIAGRLNDAQIDDVAAYLATLGRTGDGEAHGAGTIVHD